MLSPGSQAGAGNTGGEKTPIHEQMSFNITNLPAIKTKNVTVTFEEVLDDFYDPVVHKMAQSKIDTLVKDTEDKLNIEGVEQVRELLAEIDKVNLDLHGQTHLIPTLKSLIYEKALLSED